MLPPFNNTGDLPPGIHVATWSERFWVQKGMLPEDLMREFFETWQTKRDGTKRGTVEIKS